MAKSERYKYIRLSDKKEIRYKRDPRIVDIM